MFIPNNCILETNSLGSCIKTISLRIIVEPVQSKYTSATTIKLVNSLKAMPTKDSHADFQSATQTSATIYL